MRSGGLAGDSKVATEMALRRLLAEIGAGQYAAGGHRLTLDDAGRQARALLGLFDLLSASGKARESAFLADILRPLVAACAPRDYRDGVGARLCETSAYADAEAILMTDNHSLSA